jgi:hypothetical protein
MEKQKNSFEKTLFNIWCWLVTFWDTIFQNVTKDNSHCLYMRHEKGAVILQPVSQSKKSFDERKNKELKQVIKKRLLEKFKYNLLLEDCCIVIPNESNTVTFFTYSLTKGWYVPDRDEHADIELILRLSQVRENNNNIKFFYAEII